MRFNLSGASRCDRELYVENGSMGDHRYTKIIHVFYWNTHQSFPKAKMMYGIIRKVAFLFEFVIQKVTVAETKNVNVFQSTVGGRIFQDESLSRNRRYT